MLALQIKDIKSFMGKLLNTDTFDTFLLEEAAIRTANTFTIDGRIHPDFFTPEEREADSSGEEFSPWKNLKSICFQLIRGRKVPLLLKVTLLCPSKTLHALLEKAGAQGYASHIKSFALNIRYDERGLLLTTATSVHSFLPDKTPDRLWDGYLRQLLTDKGIDFEEK